MATILDGKALAEQCKQEVKKAAETLARRPGLAVIIVGNNPGRKSTVSSASFRCPRELTKRQFSWPSLQRKTWMAFIR